MFDRICRENGITHRLTKPRSPTTTGKVERFHHTLQRELLDDHPPFDSLEHAQQVIDAFRHEYNTDRPHQSLGMDFPADHFAPRPPDGLGLRLPLSLSHGQASTPPAVATPAEKLDPAPAAIPAPRQPVGERISWHGEPIDLAVEVDRIVPASGNLTVAGQQYWFGPNLGGVAITLWANTTVVHLIRDGHRIKTVPSRISTTQLQQLLDTGARPAGPPPLAADASTGPVEVDRLVNGVGCIGLVGRQHPIGYHLAGQRVTIRLDGQLMHILDTNRTLLRTLPNPLNPGEHVRDARPGGPPPAVPDAPPPVQRRVSSRGAIMVAGQKIQVGITHAGLTVTVYDTDAAFRVCDGEQLLIEVPRTATKPIARFKARKPEPPDNIR